MKRQRVLVLAPTGADGINIQAVLSEARIESEIARSTEQLIDAVKTGYGALLLTEEAITPAVLPDLPDSLARQPTWSSIPVLLLTSGGNMTQCGEEAERVLGSRAALTLIERPLRKVTLISSVRSALHGRARQFEIRDLLSERETLLASLEERVAERTIRLQQVIEELEAFSYSVSHDLRAPLRALTGYSEALLADCQETMDTRAIHYAQRISKASNSLDRLTRDLLIYTRVARQGITLERVDLDAALQEVLNHYPTITEWQQCIHILPPLGFVVAHSPSVVQCFSNLLENGIKFAKPGQPPRIRVYSRLEGTRRRIFFEDDGIGIAPENHTKAFGMFERLGGGETKGTGIGLAIVKKAVERMGAVIGLTSAVNKGSCFWIEFDDAGEETTTGEEMKTLAEATTTKGQQEGA
ncbi:MAG TPA: ATP-binding protein [Opitutaceae bacterium]|nr:ATP-binding protein [Opitutaceae bacterium]